MKKIKIKMKMKIKILNFLVCITKLEKHIYWYAKGNTPNNEMICQLIFIYLKLFM
jgi:hypothetical protein